ncbi:hypothetical protein A6X21_09255 [Planctopirus hydrillae]|uniref:Uncharacterized protein n=2 Tax=Planctopirus hydrillae TaxID=1841610 RepID=A0A1C3E7S3_9PLAN|nr:hypothetical protein A6X21_09255 [Planctopirus hydrillae]
MRDLGVGCCLAMLSTMLLLHDAKPLTADEIPADDAGVVQTQFQKNSELEYFEEIGIHQLKPGSSTSQLRKEAMADLPMHRLTAEQQKKLNSLLQSVTLYRRLPTLQFEVDADAYRFFMQHPDIAVSTWRAMDISKFQLKETATGIYHADAGDGSIGNVEVLYRDPEDTLIICDGQFKSPAVVRPITARSVMRFQASFATQPDGRVICTHRGDVFVEFPQHMVDAVARVISPVSHSIADRNFRQITLFVHMMSQMMERQPSWVESLSKKMDGISEGHRQEFVRLTQTAYQNAQARWRIANLPTSPISIDKIIEPLKIQDSSPSPAQPRVMPVDGNSSTTVSGRMVSESSSSIRTTQITPTPLHK